MAATRRRKAKDPGSIPVEALIGGHTQVTEGWRQPMDIRSTRWLARGQEPPPSSELSSRLESPWSDASAKGVVVVATLGARWLELRR